MEEDDGGLESGDFSNSPTVHQLRSKLERAEAENDELKEKLYRVQNELRELSEKQEQDDEDGGSSVIPHIKVTLIQFLRNVPDTGRQNEDLLTIIFNMMDFTNTEI